MPWSVEERRGSYCVVKDADGEVEGCHATRSEAIAQQRALYASEAMAATGPDTAELGMVALYPRREEAAALAVDGGLEVDDVHVTLVFLGDVEAFDEADVHAAVSLIAMTHEPLEGTVGGLGAFGKTSDGIPVVALPDVRGLSRLREDIAGELRIQGIESPSEHGFLPHITRIYVESLDGSEPMENVIGLPLHFDTVSVVIGGIRTDHVLNGHLVGNAAEDISRELVAAMTSGMAVAEAVDHVQELYAQSMDVERLDRALTVRVQSEPFSQEATLALVQSLEAITERAARSERESTELTAVLALLIDRIDSRPDGQQSLEALAAAIAERLPDSALSELTPPIVNVTVPPSEPVVHVVVPEQEPPIVNVTVDPPPPRRIEFERDSRGRIESAEEISWGR